MPHLFSLGCREEIHISFELIPQSGKAQAGADFTAYASRLIVLHMFPYNVKAEKKLSPFLKMSKTKF